MCSVYSIILTFIDYFQGTQDMVSFGTLSKYSLKK